MYPALVLTVCDFFLCLYPNFDEETAMTFFEARHTAVVSTLNEKLIIFHDLSALVCTGFEIRNMLYQYTNGKVNANAQKLLELWSELNLTIYNQNLKYKITWTHPRSKHGHMIDFIITCKRIVSDVCNICFIHCTKKWDTDQVQGRFKLRVRKRYCMPGMKVSKCVFVNELKRKDICENLTKRLNRLDFDGTSGIFWDQVYFTGVDVLGLQ